MPSDADGIFSYGARMKEKSGPDRRKTRLLCCSASRAGFRITYLRRLVDALSQVFFFWGVAVLALLRAGVPARVRCEVCECWADRSSGKSLGPLLHMPLFAFAFLRFFWVCCVSVLCTQFLCLIFSGRSWQVLAGLGRAKRKGGDRRGLPCLFAGSVRIYACSRILRVIRGGHRKLCSELH